MTKDERARAQHLVDVVQKEVGRLERIEAAARNAVKVWRDYDPEDEEVRIAMELLRELLEGDGWLKT